MNDIKVHVVDFKRPVLYMRFRDPLTGKQVTRSTGTGNRKAAEKLAAKWEAELQEGRYKAPSKVTWAEFRQRYEDEVLPGLADKTGVKVACVFKAIETILAPARLTDITAARLSYFASELRKRGRSESTIAGNLAHLKSALNWAHRVGLLTTMPAVPKPQRAKQSTVMKGRPITLEEFERMLGKVADGLRLSGKNRRKRDPSKKPRRKQAPQTPREISPAVIESWRHYLRGLWLSGLRLAESLELYWDRDDRLCIDLSGRFPMLRIPAELEKGHKDRLLPIAPEFAEFLQATPEEERTGRVFRPLANRSDAGLPGPDRVMKVIAAIGRAAGVKVHTHPTSGKVKHATAHDLRRSFGERWAQRVMPPVLQQLMRHESIDTTMRFYVGRNAETTSAVLWEAVGKAGGMLPERQSAGLAGNSLSNRAADSSSSVSDSTPQIGAASRVV